MPERSPRPGGTHEVVGDDEYIEGPLLPNQISGSLPLVSMAVGKTPQGTGFALIRTTSAKGPQNAVTGTFQRRWLDGPQSTEESLVIMFQALRWYLADQGITLP